MTDSTRASNKPEDLTPVDFDPFAEGEVTQVVPATESQQEIWTSVQMGDDASCAYNESVTVRMSGPLDVDILQSALGKTIQRHESLRATFSPDGQFLCINVSLEVETPLVDLAEKKPGKKAEELKTLQRREVSTPFDLEHGPLIRSTIVRLGAEDHALLITTHHIICDGWSIDVVVNDLSAYYTAARQGNDRIDLGEADQFSAYAMMTRNQTDMRYWARQFSDDIPLLDLPTDRMRPTTRSFASDRIDHRLAPALITGIKQTGAKLGCTFVNMLFAGCKAFLHRITGQNDLVVGLPAAGQAIVGQDHLVGHCVNLLPVRSQLDPEQPFSEYLKSLRTVMLDSYEHQEFTFGALLRELPLPRDPSRIPLVPVVFNIDQGIDCEAIHFDKIKVDFYSNPRAFENFELFINVTPVDEGFIIECQYKTDLFERETIEKWIECLETMLSSIVSNPDQRICDLKLLTPAEERRLATQWNQTAINYPKNRQVHELFEDQATRSPEREAIRSGDQKLSYGELNQRANRLAHRLRALGAGPDVLVALCVDRSVAMVVALLGILKSGAAYVPLDIDYPKERLNLMLEDSEILLLVSQENLAKKLPQHKAQPVLLDADGAITGEEQNTNPQRQGTSEDLAYLLYTSGSTGVPKGVRIPHYALINLLTSMQRQTGLTEQDQFLSVTTLSFDIGTAEIFLPLIIGARLYIVDRETASDGFLLKNVLRSEQISVMLATPVTYKLLLEAGWRKVKKLKALCAGEVLLRHLADRILATGAELWNLYGPTETTIYSTGQRIGPGSETPQIGKPIANTCIYILDSHKNLLPIGVPGELCIGGDGLAQGYHNRPDLTLEAFIDDPYSDVPGSRLYRTGDIACRCHDGSIDFLGRLDSQVKLRGFRIELGEIENVLNQHPAARQAVAVIRDNASGEKTLVAYVEFDALNDTTHTGSKDTRQQQIDSAERRLIPELRDYLREKIPGYMIPSSLILLNALPLTPNGKIDRKALPEPSGERPELSGAFETPKTPLEKQIAEILANVLEVDHVGLHDDFFELGGHSLLATQTIAHLRESLDIDLALRVMFVETTVARLAEYIEAMRYVATGSESTGDASARDRVEFEL